MAYILIQFCSVVYVYMGYKIAEINYLPICSLHCICWVWYPLFRLRYRARYNHLRNICRRLVNSIMVALVTSNIHHLAPHSQKMCRFFIQDIFLGSFLAIVNQILLARNSKIVSDVTAPLRVTRGIERTFSHPFSETFRISKKRRFQRPISWKRKRISQKFLRNCFQGFKILW